MFEGKAVCPRCYKVWVLPQASPGRYCDCHLICPDGSSLSDCNMTAQNYSGSLAWPIGSDQAGDQEADDVRHRTYYCSVHDKYSYKEPVWVEVDWQRWYQRKKLPVNLREMRKR